jgi:antitoxin (DNA-binding transcriptional repressor) of toxin-antitoxin stability system
MNRVNMLEAKTHLSRLVDAVESGSDYWRVNFPS